MKKGKHKKKRFECPNCDQDYESEKRLDGHCRNYHGKSLKELREIKEQSRMTLGDFVKKDDEDE